MRLAEKLWLVESSQPRACDPILKAWRDADNLTDELAWKRYSMALTANNVTLARYLIRFVKDQDKILANNFRMAHIRPDYINRTRLFTGTDDKSRSVILHGIKRLANKNPLKALDTLNKYQISHQFSLSELESISTYIGVRLARDPDTLHALNQMPINLSQNQKVIGVRLLTALRQLNWNDVLAFIHNLESDAQLSNRWQYWKARILSRSDDIYDQQTANGIFESLADHRGFYGFMSADILGRNYNFEDESIAVSDAEILALEAIPGIQRALELLVLDERIQARREWNFTTRHFSPMQLQIAARVASKWGWHHKAIAAIIDAKAWNDLDIRFPLAFHDNFIIGARTADIPVDWNIAIARQESAFMPDARSPVGARGIMQLMPATARLTARKVGMRNPSTHDLNNPTTNIQLGSAYLGQMMRKFGNNRILASAAYNAGPSRVRSWLDDKLPLDVWIETIPYDETRNYVMNVLVFSAIYSRKLNRQSPLVYDHERRSFSRQQITSSATAARDNS